MSERDLDVVVFGATGVTGRQVAAYLAGRGPEAGASWAAAGRDPVKLERVLGEVGVSASATIVAELGDPDSLAAMASRARVVLNLVGPYARYGAPVIEACIAGGAHYVDLTGEMPFVRRTIRDSDAAATEAGVKVVQTAGFEALPPDLGILLAAEAAEERWGEGLAEVDLSVSTQAPPGLRHPSELLSGGTLQSLAAIFSDEDASAMSDPACLIGDPVMAEAVRRRSPISVMPWRRDGEVVAPMAPSPYINPAVIHRSAALRAAGLEGPFNPFRYREGVAIGGSAPTLPLRYAAAGALSATQLGVGLLAGAGAGARRTLGGWLERALPSSGFGPKGEEMEAWRWGISIDARTVTGRTLAVSVEARAHPGYLGTARMMGEAGLLLAGEGTPDRAGCLTPAHALGADSAPAFEHAGVTFSVGEAARG